VKGGHECLPAAIARPGGGSEKAGEEEGGMTHLLSLNLRSLRMEEEDFSCGSCAGDMCCGGQGSEGKLMVNKPERLSMSATHQANIKQSVCRAEPEYSVPGPRLRHVPETAVWHSQLVQFVANSPRTLEPPEDRRD
jgi:hypothetical protein